MRMIVAYSVLAVVLCCAGTMEVAAQLPRVGSVIDFNEARYFGIRSRGADPDLYHVVMSDSLILYGYVATDSLNAVDTVRFSPHRTQLVKRYLEEYEALALADTAWYLVDTGYVRMAQNLSVALEYDDDPREIGLASGSDLIVGLVVARTVAGVVVSSRDVHSTIRGIKERPYVVVNVEDIDSLTIMRNGEAVGWIPTRRQPERTNGLLTAVGARPLFPSALPPEVASDLELLPSRHPEEDISVPDAVGRHQAWRLDAAAGPAFALQRPVVRLDIVGRAQEPRSVSSKFSDTDTLQYTMQASLVAPLTELFDIGIGGSAVFEGSTTADSADVGHLGFDSYQGDVRVIVHLGRVDRYGYRPLGLTAGVRVGVAMTSVRWWTSYQAHQNTGQYWDSHEYEFVQFALGGDLRLWWWPSQRLGIFVGGQLDGRFGGDADPESVTYIDYGQFYTVTRVLESSTNLTASALIGIAVNL